MTTEFKTWEEMSGLEQAQTIWWDMYKDAHGFRPRGIDTSSWTLEDFQQEFKYLQDTIEACIARQAEAEQAAIQKFESRVVEVIAMGAGDRATALRWIMEGSEADGDWEYYCYLNNLPYGYFKSNKA